MTNSDEYSRPATLEDLRNLISSLNEKHAPYLLIGGYALFSHGYHRTTEDIDLLVPSGADAGKILIDALMVLPDKSAADLKPEWFEEGENIRLADEIVIDLIFVTCGETYESLLKYSETLDLDGIEVKTVSLEGLLKTKQSLREKDKIDRMVLERALSEVNKSK